MSEVVERTEHGWKINGKTRTERMRQVRQVPFSRIKPLSQLRSIQRNMVCRGCGGKITLRVVNNFDCDDTLLWSRTQWPVCNNGDCSRGIEYGVDPEIYNKALNYCKKHTYGDSREAYRGWGKSRRYNYYYLSNNVSSLIDLWFTLKNVFDPAQNQSNRGRWESK